MDLGGETGDCGGYADGGTRESWGAGGDGGGEPDVVDLRLVFMYDGRKSHEPEGLTQERWQR